MPPDGYVSYKRQQQTPTQNALDIAAELDALYRKVRDKERELSVYMRMPGFDEDEFQTARLTENR